MKPDAKPIAEILRGIRSRGYQEKDADTFAAYCFFGDPQARLEFARPNRVNSERDMEFDRGISDGSGGVGENGDRKIWPAWNSDHGYARLAEYVASARTRSTVSGSALRWSTATRHSRTPATRAQALYELLREKGLTYDLEKRFTARVTQQVRDPWELLDDGHGTCLDFATTYATMCMASFVDVLLRPVLPHHAFVVLTPSSGSRSS